jgi:hypothetical protein
VLPRPSEPVGAQRIVLEVDLHRWWQHSTRSYSTLARL